MIYLFTPSGRVLETQPMRERPTKCAIGAGETLYVTTEAGHLFCVRR